MAGTYTDVIANWSTASTSLTLMNSGTSATAGVYYPQLNGRLVRLDIFLTHQAATSLAEAGRLELSQTNWTPNIVRFAFGGFGLATVPALEAPSLTNLTYPIDQPIRTDWPITANVIFFWSPVTPAIYVQGTFTY